MLLVRSFQGDPVVLKFSLASALTPCVFFAIGISVASADVPKQPVPVVSPTPSPTPKPKSLLISGNVRGYQFDREVPVNTPALHSQSSTNFSGFVHADYKFAKTGFTLGASYLGAYAFGLNGLHPERNGLADNTLPGATLSAFPETYLKYQSPRFTATLGNQILNEKWMPNSDTRLKPAAYQGLEASYTVSKNVTVTAARVIRFMNRTESKFTRNTLLTSFPLGGGKPAIIEDTSGTLFANVKYATPGISALVENYSFYQIANLQYAEVKANIFGGRAKPYVAAQYVGENQAGQAILGLIHNHTYGLQVGANVTKELLATVSYDGSPTDLSATKSGLFRPIGSPAAPYSYGGIATPYTDGYATDPLFTTSLTQGPVETQTPRSYKAGLYYTSPDKRLGIYATRTYFEHVGYNPRNTMYESDGDVTYYLNSVGKGAYKGLSIRERYGVRNQPFVKTNPSFQYVRTQVQYSF